MEHPVIGSLSESGNVIIYYSAHAGPHNILDFVKKQKRFCEKAKNLGVLISVRSHPA